MKSIIQLSLIIFFFLGCRERVIAQEIPVLAFHGVQKEYTSLESFQKLKNAGININLTIYKNNNEVQEALDCALIAGVKIVIYSYDLVNRTKETVLKFKNHPALYGYYIGDEPDATAFYDLRRKIEEIKKYDSLHPCYINLFPNYADNMQLRSYSYADYLAKYINTVPIDFISFDNYPLMNNKIHNDWYQNLEMIRNASILSKKDFWGFANATVFGPYKQPSVAGLKLQMYSNLLYGAQGLQYFTYWTLDDDHWKKSGFGHAMVDAKGNPTPTYDVVKKVNQDIQKFSKVFLGSKVKSVFHTTNSQPNFTKKLPAIPENFEYFSASNPAVVSYLENGNSQYVVILNKSITENLNLVIQPKNQLTALQNPLYNIIPTNKKTSFTIEPGDIVVLEN